MPKVSDIFPGEFYNASHFTEQPVYGLIVAAVSEMLGRPPSPKVVLELRNADGSAWPRRLPLNRSNSIILANAFGDEIGPWLGKAIEVWSEPTTFDDKPTMGIVVKPSAYIPASSGSVIAMPAPAKPRGGDLDDDIPFDMPDFAKKAG